MSDTQRSSIRILQSSVDVNSWTSSTPSCSAVRPVTCAACGAASREPGRPLTIVGHGLRARGIEGPPEPDEEATCTELLCRRSVCNACGAILVVVPRGIGRGIRYSLAAIAYALALWGYARATAAEARAKVSAAKARGFTSPDQWSSLRRWTSRARSIFGADAPLEGGSLRERAARLATWLASHAPLPTSQVPRDAFFGGRFVHAR
ncbi:MAG: hypothetical protein M5U28_03395 [Sandaracinaceae bacterium]|nr:hypothetical protein [Sandaracinaceae bacterium]